MECLDPRPSLVVDPSDDATVAELVLKIHRCAMAGLCFGDTRSWDWGWRLLAQVAPREEVGPLFGQFYGFGRSLLAAAQRPLSCRPIFYCGHCAEEALALRMIESAQRADHAATLSAASDLLQVDDLGGVLQATQSLASALRARGLCVRGVAEAAPDPRSLAKRRRPHLRLAIDR